MNVWIKETRKRVLCKYCERYIEVGEFQVVCRYYMKLRHSSKTWTKTMHFHAKKPACWVERAIVELKKKPYSESRGRRPDPLNDNEKMRRQKILRRRSSVMQRIKEEMGDKMRLDKVAHLTDLLDKLIDEIEPLGGVPTSWL